MKVEDVPQDLKYFKDSVVRDVAYAVDNDGKYQMVMSDGWEVKNDALDVALESEERQQASDGTSGMKAEQHTGNTEPPSTDSYSRSKEHQNTGNQDNIIELPLKHQAAAHCENGAISTLLRYHGISLSEPMIFGLASGLFFVHMPFIKMGGMPVTAFRTFPGVLFKRITKSFGIKTATRRYLKKEHAMRDLDRLLKEQTPVGCVVGMFELPYIPVEYRSRFNGHNICVIGKNEQTGDYIVLDSNAIQKVTISREDLLRVRFAEGGTYPLLGQMYWIKSMPKQLPELKPLILKSIKKTCWWMVSQPAFIPFAGANGIVYLSKRIRKWEQTMGKRRAKSNLAQLIRMLEEIGTGGAGFRFIYGAFLQEAADVTGITALNGYSERITAIGDLWRDFAYKASRIIKKRAGENYTYDDLSDLLLQIGEQERSFFLDLKRDVEKW